MVKDKINKISNNSRNVIINAINGIGIKGLSIIIGLLTTPAYMQYFNNDAVLGVWFTLLSVLAWILNFDLGIGNGLRNHLVVTFVKKDEVSSKKYISSAYIFLFTIATIICVILFIFVRLINWNDFFGVPESDINSQILQSAIIIILVSIILQFVLRIITSILYALQKAFVPNMISLITNILLLTYLKASNYLGNNNNIIGLALFYLIAVNVPLLCTTLVLFFTKLKNIRPSFRYFEMKYALATLKVGGAFLGLQIEAMIINNTSIFMITWLLGSIYVVEYNVYFKVFSMASTMFSLLAAPVWSATTKAKSEKNYLWIKKTLRVLQLIALLFVVAELCIMPFMQFVFDIWLGENSFIVDVSIMMIFAIDQGIIIWSNINATICNGLNELKLQFILMTCGAIILVPLAIALTNIMEGYYAVTVAHIAALIPYCIGQSIWLEYFIRKGESS